MDISLDKSCQRFYDPTFADTAWENYHEYHKSPRKQPAGAGFSDPEFLLPIEWLETRKAIQQAESRQKHHRSKSRILLINGSTRSAVAREIDAIIDGDDLKILPATAERLVFPFVLSALPLLSPVYFGGLSDLIRQPGYRGIASTFLNRSANRYPAKYILRFAISLALAG